MSDTLKLVIGVGAALVLGGTVGFVGGRAGQGALVSQLSLKETRLKEAEGVLRQQQKDCEAKAKGARASKMMMRAKERLLRAALELYSNNYGLTSQHLGVARRHLKAAAKDLPEKRSKQVTELFDQVGSAQTLTMRLDPMARVQIDQILAKLNRIPGAR